MSEANQNIKEAEFQRQSLLGVAVFFVRRLKIFYTIFLGLFILALSRSWVGALLLYGILPLCIALIIFAWFEYRRFTYQLKKDSLIIRKGVFFTERVEIGVDRIQSIHVTEDMIQRILGLASLKLDTAGAGKIELEIPALKRERAEALKNLLYFRNKEAVSDAGQKEDDFTEEIKGSQPAKESVLVSLGIRDLFVVGLTENHLKSGFIAAAFVFGTVQQYKDTILEYLGQYTDSYTSEVMQSGIRGVLMLLVLFAVFSVLLSLVRTLLRFYNCRVILRTGVVEISTGLLKRNNFRVPVKKVQLLSFERNPLRGWAGFESAELKVSSSEAHVSRKQHIEIPALKKLEREILIQGIFKGYRVPSFELKPNALSYSRYYGLVSAILVIPITIWLTTLYGFVALWFLVVMVLATIWGIRHGRSVRLLFDKDFVQIHKGWVFVHRMVIPTYKLQGGKIRQNIFIARRNLCHLTLFTAGGDISIRYLPLADAQALADYLLYRVEQSDTPWM